MRIKIGQESMSEVDIRFEEEHSHSLIAKIDKHAVGHELFVIFVSGAPEIDDRSEHIDSFFDLLLLSCGRIVDSGGVAGGDVGS